MKKKIKKQIKHYKKDPENWIIPACLFIGIGIGLLIKEIMAFLFIGIGAAFLILYLNSKKKK